MSAHEGDTGGLVRRTLELSARVSSQSEVLLVEEGLMRAALLPSGCIEFSAGSSACSGLRMFRHGKLGMASTSEPEEQADLIERAISSARSGQPVEYELPAELGPPCNAEPRLVHHDASSMTHAGMGDFLDRLRAALADLSPHASLIGSMSLEDVTVTLGNSRGFLESYRKAAFRLALRFSFPTSEGLFPYYHGWTSGYIAMQPEEIAAEAFRAFTWASRRADGPVRGPLLMSPGALAVLLQALRTGVSARRRLRGSSPLIGKQGEKVLSSMLTLHDRPALDYGAASAPFDAEGIRTRDKPLFERGVFSGFLYDLATAWEAGTESTGSAGRNCTDPPEPVCTNLTMEPGKASFQGMLEDMDSGLLVLDLLSGGSSNVITGDFSFDTSSAFLVESGEIVGRMGRAVVSGNVYDLLSGIISVESSLHLIGSDWLPHLLVESPGP